MITVRIGERSGIFYLATPLLPGAGLQAFARALKMSESHRKCYQSYTPLAHTVNLE
jgi:hypothetical protein